MALSPDGAICYSAWMADEGEFSVDVNVDFDVKRLKGGFQNAAEFALEKIANRLLSDSRIYVPVLTGALRDSGRVEQLPTQGDAIAMFQVRYNIPYAKTQHEDEYRHPSLGFFGAARYLTKPMEIYGEFYLRLYAFEFDEYVRRHGLKA